MSTTKKRPLLKAVKKIFQFPLIRGILKSFPVGNWAYEVAQNIKHYKDPKKANEPAPHSAISLLAQAVFLGLIIYAFVTKQITIDQVLNFIDIDDFKNFNTGLKPIENGVLDSISH
jgi:hypothetical protein